MDLLSRAAIALLRLSTRLEADQARIALLDLLAMATDPTDALASVSAGLSVELHAERAILAGESASHSVGYAMPQRAAQTMAGRMLSLGGAPSWTLVGAVMAGSIAPDQARKAIDDAEMML
jgi:hypothetical protein